MLEITGGRGVNFSIDTTGVATVTKATIDIIGIGEYVPQLRLHRTVLKLAH